MSIEQHFPSATTEIREARQSLARLYLEGERWDQALDLFDNLAASNEPDDRAFAFAGRSFVYARRKERDQAAKALEDLAYALNEDRAVLEPEIRQLASRAVQYVRREGDQQRAAKWDALLESPEEEDLDGDDE